MDCRRWLVSWLASAERSNRKGLIHLSVVCGGWVDLDGNLYVWDNRQANRYANDDTIFVCPPRIVLLLRPFPLLTHCKLFVSCNVLHYKLIDKDHTAPGRSVKNGDTGTSEPVKFIENSIFLQNI